MGGLYNVKLWIGYSLKKCGLPRKNEKIIIECNDDEDLERIL